MRTALVLGVAAFLFHIVDTHAANTAPAEVFGAIPQASEIDLSPNGSLLAWCHTAQAGTAVVIFDVNAQKYVRTIPIERGVKLRSISWADNETVLITISVFVTYNQSRATDHYEVARTFAADVAGGQQRMLLMADGARGFVNGATLHAARTSKPKTVIMSSWDYSAASERRGTDSRLTQERRDSGWADALFEVDTRTGKGRKIESGTPYTADWVVDNDGAAVARSEWNPTTEVFTILAKEGTGWRQLLREEHQRGRALYGLSSDGKSLLIEGTGEKGLERLEALPLDGSPPKVLYEDATYGVVGVIHDRFTRAPVSAVLGGPQETQHWFDADAERRAASVKASFPGKTVHVYARSEDNKRVIAEVEGPSSPPVYYLIDFAAKKADVVAEAYPALASTPLGEVRVISYKARDGADVPAYLTLPPGSSGKNLPLILLPHGGPEARDDYAFDWLAQFYATRGYAVLQPQFRGSTGFGDHWRQAGYRQWGMGMQDDLSDGVKALIEQGVADAKRVCIVGASYGGYAALAGATLTPDLYRCAVSINGVSDLPQFLAYQNSHAGELSNSVAYWRDHIGPANDKAVIDKSPTHAAAQVKAAVLLLHSENDTVVPFSQSEMMAHAMSVMDKSATLVKLAGEDHWLSQTETRVQVLKETERFLQANLK